MDEYFKWIGNGAKQEVELTARAKKSTGGWDTANCSFSIIVNGKFTVFEEYLKN